MCMTRWRYRSRRRSEFAWPPVAIRRLQRVTSVEAGSGAKSICAELRVAPRSQREQCRGAFDPLGILGASIGSIGNAPPNGLSVCAKVGQDPAYRSSRSRRQPKEPAADQLSKPVDGPGVIRAPHSAPSTRPAQRLCQLDEDTCLRRWLASAWPGNIERDLRQLQIRQHAHQTSGCHFRLQAE